MTWASVEKPNGLVIIVDDLGYGDLSSYGAKDLRSPHLDKLAAEGVRFTECYANCPVCSPTRATLLTGRYQELVGVPGVIRTRPEDNWGYLAPSANMLPQTLKPQKRYPQPFKRDVFFTPRERNMSFIGDSTWAMRLGPWKLLKNRPDSKWKLFNLETGPLETTDLSQKEGKKCRELATAMGDHIKRRCQIVIQSGRQPPLLIRKAVRNI